jgi:hypothetical protein
MSETTKMAAESTAEFNGAGPTVDAAVSVAKPNVGKLLNENKGYVVASVIGAAVGLLVHNKLVGGVAKSAQKVQSVAEQAEEAATRG